MSLAGTEWPDSAPKFLLLEGPVVGHCSLSLMMFPDSMKGRKTPTADFRHFKILPNKKPALGGLAQGVLALNFLAPGETEASQTQAE
jgi:hypothetical protein